MSLTPLNYCIRLVKRLDYEGYIATLFYPRQARSAAFTLRAFNLEMAQAYHASRDRKLVQARLQFWMNAIENISRSSKTGTEIQFWRQNMPATPVCEALAKYSADFRFPEYWLKRLVSARLDAKESFATMAELERYGEDTQAVLYYMMLHLLKVKEMGADMAARHLGKGITIANFIRAIPNYARKGIAPVVPQEIMEKHQITYSNLLKGMSNPGVRTAVFEMAAVANDHFETAADLKKKIQAPARVLFLSSEPLERYLTNLRDSFFNPFDKQVAVREKKSASTLPLRLYLLNRRNKNL